MIAAVVLGDLSRKPFQFCRSLLDGEVLRVAVKEHRVGHVTPALGIGSGSRGKDRAIPRCWRDEAVRDLGMKTHGPAGTGGGDQFRDTASARRRSAAARASSVIVAPASIRAISSRRCPTSIRVTRVATRSSPVSSFEIRK